MRRTKYPQSSLVAPLNRIFKTEANVRVLRVLALTREPLVKADVAQRARLDPSGVRRALNNLIVQGVIENVGAGAYQPVRLRDSHPLAEALREIYRAEAARARAVMDKLRKVARGIRPAPQAIWVTIPTEATETAEVERIEVGVLSTVKDVDSAVEQFCKSVTDIQREADALVEIRGYVLADLITLSSVAESVLATAIPLLGPPPESFIRGADRSNHKSRIETHADLDVRALTLGRAIGLRIVRDPTIIERAREYVQRYLETAPPGERKEMEEWSGILDALPPPRLRQFLVDRGARATRLRQSWPFLDVLSQSEREELMKELSLDKTAA